MLRNVVETRIQELLTPIALSLHRRRISPNTLTVTGLIVNCIGAYCYYRGLLVVGGIVILFAGLFDMLDGSVARVGGNESKIGAFTDSVVDRYSDFLIFGGVLAYFARKGDLAGTLLVLTILCGAFLVSYVRARAELVIPSCAVGLMERPERILILAGGSMFYGLFTPALWFLRSPPISPPFTAFTIPSKGPRPHYERGKNRG